VSIAVPFSCREMQNCNRIFLRCRLVYHLQRVLDHQCVSPSRSKRAFRDSCSINSARGVLTFNSAPDFETPGDADADNVREVEVTLTDVPEEPTITSQQRSP